MDLNQHVTQPSVPPTQQATPMETMYVSKCQACGKQPRLVFPEFYGGRFMGDFWIGCCVAHRVSHARTLARAIVVWNFFNVPFYEADDAEYVIEGVT
jgi:hypothetical protein